MKCFPLDDYDKGLLWKSLHFHLEMQEEEEMAHCKYFIPCSPCGSDQGWGVQINKYLSTHHGPPTHMLLILCSLATVAEKVEEVAAG